MSTLGTVSRMAKFEQNNASSIVLALPADSKASVKQTNPVLDGGATLFRWNTAMFLFHAALMTVTLGVGNRALEGLVYATNLEFVERSNVTNISLAFALIPSYVEYGSIPLTWLTALFFLCSAVAHFGNAFLWQTFYKRDLTRCRVTTRWVEYFFSAPLMIVSIAYGAGVREYTLLFAIAMLIATTMPFGYLTELLAEPASDTEWKRPLSTRLLPHFIGYIPQLTAWAVILFNFYDQPYVEGQSAPWFVTVIIFSEMGLFFSFGFVQLVQQCSQPRRFYVGEIAYQWLSLISKGLLGTLLIANILVLGSFDEIFESTNASQT